MKILYENPEGTVLPDKSVEEIRAKVVDSQMSDTIVALVQLLLETGVDLGPLDLSPDVIDFAQRLANRKLMSES